MANEKVTEALESLVSDFEAMLSRDNAEFKRGEEDGFELPAARNKVTPGLHHQREWQDFVETRNGCYAVLSYEQDTDWTYHTVVFEAEQAPENYYGFQSLHSLADDYHPVMDIEYAFTDPIWTTKDAHARLLEDIDRFGDLRGQHLTFTVRELYTALDEMERGLNPSSTEIPGTEEPVQGEDQEL